MEYQIIVSMTAVRLLAVAIQLLKSGAPLRRHLASNFSSRQISPNLNGPGDAPSKNFPFSCGDPSRHLLHREVKVAHTRLPSVGFRSWSRFLAVSPGVGRYQFRCLVNRGMMGVNSLPKTVTRQRRGCDLNPGPSAPESSTLTTQLPRNREEREEKWREVNGRRGERRGSERRWEGSG